MLPTIRCVLDAHQLADVRSWRTRMISAANQQAIEARGLSSSWCSVAPRLTTYVRQAWPQRRRMNDRSPRPRCLLVGRRDQPASPRP